MQADLFNKDAKERELALNPAESFIVQAPAGSGKTELIIQRLLVLLSHVKQPQEILAITFTKKAANEMRSRIIHALEFAANNSAPEKSHELKTWTLAHSVLKRDKELGWNLTENPNQLQIKTIDSFCSYLTSQLPLLSHFGSQPEITTNPTVFYREAVQEVLSHIEHDYDWSKAVSELLLHADNDLNRIENLLIQLLGKRDQWLHYLTLDFNEPETRALFDEQIAAVITMQLKQAVSLFPADLDQDLLKVARFAANNMRTLNPDSILQTLHDITQIPTFDAQDLYAWQALATIVLTKDFNWRKQLNPDVGFPFLKDLDKETAAEHKPFRALHKKVMDVLRDNENLRAILENILKLPDNHYSDQQWDILKALLDVLKIVTAQLRVTFQSHGKIDFIENAQAANQALGNDENPTDLALALDYKINHVLVDEFQDTSSTQYQLIKKLTHGWMPGDGRSLFVVGDPMQSIYRFRLAEVGLFIRMQKLGLADIRLTPITLSVNFRSARQIVDWNNLHFTKIFPQYSDIGSGAVHYSQSITSRDEDINSTIKLTGFQNSQQQAKGVIETINDTLNQYPQEKIAILVRSRPHLAHIIPALKAANIEFNAIAIDSLMEKQCIQDILALTRALLHPCDTIAWLAVLRAPWCGLLLSDLVVIRKNKKYPSVLHCLNDATIMNALNFDAKQRVTRVYTILTSAIKNRQRHPFRYWIEKVWLALGGPATLQDVTDINDINEYFQLLDEISNTNQPITSDVINERLNGLFASSHHDNAKVQIMTVHSAKGLEFDTVILPHLEKTSQADDKNLLSWIDYPLDEDNSALLLAPLHATGDDKDKLYSFITHQQRIKSDFETDRLFYVATTRAKYRLHLMFNHKDDKKNERKGSFLAKLWPLIKNHATLQQPDESVNDTDKLHQPSVKRHISRMDTNWVNPVNLMEQASQSTHKKQRGFQYHDDAARLIGTVTHTLLQQIASKGANWWQENQGSQRNYIIKLLMHAGIDKSQTQFFAKHIQSTLQKMLEDKTGSWLLGKHEQDEYEYVVNHKRNNKIETYAIDRMFIENEIRWIVDYKTATPSDQTIDDFINEQAEKYYPQLAKYKHAIQEIDAREIKLGLYFPSIQHWYVYPDDYSTNKSG